MNVPETRYAKTADGVHVAYHAFGDGPVDILFVLGWVTHLERQWSEHHYARCFTRLGSFGRVMISTCVRPASWLSAENELVRNRI